MSTKSTNTDLLHPMEDFGHPGHVQDSHGHKSGHDDSPSPGNTAHYAGETEQSVLPPYQPNIPQPVFNEKLRNKEAKGGELL